MTRFEQSMVVALLFIGAILITLAYPDQRDLAASTRAMLHGGFEGRTTIVSTMPIVATADLLRRSML